MVNSLRTTIQKIHLPQEATVILFQYFEELDLHSQMHSLHIIHICGYESTIQKNHVANRHWIFNAIDNHNTELIYHRFHMIFSHLCILSYLRVIKSFKNCSNQMTYCGHLPMWNETCSCTSIYFQSTQTYTASVHEFDIFYFISRLHKTTIRANIHVLKDHSEVPLMLWYGNKIIHHSTIYAYAKFKMLIQFDSSNSGGILNHSTYIILLISIIINEDTMWVAI